MVRALNQWRLSQNPPLSSEEAIRELLQRALVHEGYGSGPVGNPVRTGAARQARSREKFLDLLGMRNNQDPSPAE
jgi:hypothetical protein